MSDRRAGSPLGKDDLGQGVLGVGPDGNYAVMDLSSSIPQPVATGNTGAATHAAVALSYGANINVAHCLSGISWSYSGGTPVGGLTVKDGASDVVFQLDITAAGPNFIPFAPPVQGTPGRAMTVTLADGGSGIAGKVNANHFVRYAVAISGGLDFTSPGNSQYIPLL